MQPKVVACTTRPVQLKHQYPGRQCDIKPRHPFSPPADLGEHETSPGPHHAYPLGVEEVVGAWGLDDLGLLLNVEVLPGELRVNVLLVQLHDLIVADAARVGVVHDACQPPLCLQLQHAASQGQIQVT